MCQCASGAGAGAGVDACRVCAVDLHPFISGRTLACLNELEPGSIASVVRPNRELGSPRGACQSACDNELLVRFSFSASVSLTGVLVGTSGCTLTEARLFPNNPQVDFDSVQSLRAADCFLLEDEQAVRRIDLRPHRYQNVVSLSLLLRGRPRLRLQHLGFTGTLLYVTARRPYPLETQRAGRHQLRGSPDAGGGGQNKAAAVPVEGRVPRAPTVSGTAAALRSRPRQRGCAPAGRASSAFPGHLLTRWSAGIRPRTFSK